MRRLVLALLPIASASVGCAASGSETGDAETATTTSAVVVVERTADALQGARAEASARFVRVTASTSPASALRSVGAGLDLPTPGACAPLSALTGIAASGDPVPVVELLDVGPVSLEANGVATRLLPRQLPDVTDVVSGVVYARAADAPLLPAAASYVVHVSGGTSLGALDVPAFSPAEPNSIRILAEEVDQLVPELPRRLRDQRGPLRFVQSQSQQRRDPAASRSSRSGAAAPCGVTTSRSSTRKHEQITGSPLLLQLPHSDRFPAGRLASDRSFFGRGQSPRRQSFHRAVFLPRSRYPLRRRASGFIIPDARRSGEPRCRLPPVAAVAVAAGPCAFAGTVDPVLANLLLDRAHLDGGPSSSTASTSAPPTRCSRRPRPGQIHKAIPLDTDPENKGDPTILRSILYFPHMKQCFFGARAIREFAHHDMEGRLIRSIKKFLPVRSFVGHVGRRPAAQSGGDIISIFLGRDAQEGQRAFRQDVDRAVIGRPARFSDNDTDDAFAQYRLEKAAKAAGFKHVDFFAEPIAAAYGFRSASSTPAPEPMP